MTLLNQALRGSLSPAAASAATRRRVLAIGAGGPLGSAVLEQLLGRSAWAGVATLVTQPMAVAMRGLEAWTVAAEFLATPPALPWRPDTAVVVFDRVRGSRFGREATLWRPEPASLPALGAWLAAAGVRELLVVLPHAPGLLPQALRQGLASLDEQALTTLGFAHLVFVRPAHQAGLATAGSPAAGSAPQRLALALLRQLHWMVPQREAALRPVRVAAFVAVLARALPAVPPGTRVVPPELVWDWAQPGGGDAVLDAWLHGRARPSAALAHRRW